MAEFLDTFDVERDTLLKAVAAFDEVWARFQEQRTLEVEGQDLSDSLISTELTMVRAELAAAKFTIGVFGLIKRGKSTLLNAMIGLEVSSMHVTPETAVPVYVDYGEVPGATVHFGDGTRKEVAVEDVKQFTSQKFNAGNQLGVTYVHQVVPVKFLKNGTQLIDTPGLDDADADDIYTERTMQELDKSDAGIVVFLSPPTVGATEMSFLTEVVSRDLKKTFLVCNMYPQHFHDDETRNAVLQYVGGRIVEASARAGHAGQIKVFPICALEAWEARRDEDIDKWKSSGADRLMRELEMYLSNIAGAQVLHEAANRVVNAAHMAKSEVQVRKRLLESPDQLEHYRASVDEDVRNLEAEFEMAISNALADVHPLKMRVRGVLMKPFAKASTAVDRLESQDEIEKFSNKFRREVEVAGEVAKSQFEVSFTEMVERVRERLEQRFAAVMGDLIPNLPQVTLNSRTLLLPPDKAMELLRADQAAKKTIVSSALGGGLAGGGAAFAAAGAVLGPLGLIGGALVGGMLSHMLKSGKGLDQAKVLLKARVDEIAAQLVGDFDNQVDAAVGALRASVALRREQFASDLYAQFNLVQSLANSPDLLERHRQAADQFIQAFDAAARKAKAAVTVPLPVQ